MKRPTIKMIVEKERRELGRPLRVEYVQPMARLNMMVLVYSALYREEGLKPWRTWRVVVYQGDRRISSMIMDDPNG